MLQIRLLRGCILLLSSLWLLSCSSTDTNRLHQAIHSDDPHKALSQIAKDKAKHYSQSPEQLIKDVKTLNEKFKDLEAIVKVIWGKDFGTLPGSKKYVKYTNDYQSKAEVDFALGVVRVETISSKDPLTQLNQAIVITLLTTSSLADNDIFSDKTPTLGGKPYLYQQVLDQDNQPIAYQWRANRFAEYLIKTQLKKRKVGFKNSHYVEIKMVGDHLALRQKQYAEHVLSAANRYQVKPSLIYAIIETESSFNPYAVSPSNAYGLMQIVPKTAGKDVYQKVLNKSGTPTKEVLFTPKDNIHIGTAYLHLLDNRYLAKINDPQSRHYATISAYNGGAGNVFNTFSKDRDKAPALINKLSANNVYQKLINHHPRQESRRYLQKVVKAQTQY